jgi:uncharacterized protein (TIGR02266 family)
VNERRPSSSNATPPGGEHDRRQRERLTINKQFDSFDQFVKEYVTNLSGEGAFVRTDAPLPVGTEVRLRFSVVLDGVENVEGVGVVVRVQTDPPGMGVVFRKLEAYSARLVERLLSGAGIGAPGSTPAGTSGDPMRTHESKDGAEGE